ncbi:MAG: cytochrome c [Verrucomicrobiota bacterium]|nr:cytochrome c [Verrucomicrobiota bacterium]
MQILRLLKPRRWGRLVWACASVALGSILFAKTLAQSAPIATYENGSNTPEATNRAPTYLHDIRPIIMGHCARCHNRQDRFIYDWLNYKTAYANRWEIRRRVWDSWKGTYYKESMPVANSPEALSITKEDRLTIRNWADDGAPRGVAPPPGASESKAEQIERGKRIFTSICAACHQPTGRGLPNVFPPLAGSDFLNADKDRAIQTVIFGRQGEVVVNGQKFNNTMPALPLNDQDIANVLTYVYNSFGNAGLKVTPEEVAALRSHPPAPAPASSAAPAPKNPFE